MVKIHRIGDKHFYITTESLFHSIIKDGISLMMIYGLTYLNYTYTGNSWYIGLFIILVMLGFISRIFKKEISKEEVLEELEI